MSKEHYATICTTCWRECEKKILPAEPDVGILERKVSECCERPYRDVDRNEYQIIENFNFISNEIATGNMTHFAIDSVNRRIDHLREQMLEFYNELD